MSDDAAELLYRSLGALSTPEFGVINLMPFAQDTPETNAFKRAICNAVVRLYRDHGYKMDKDDVAAVKTVSRDITLACRSCSSPLLHTHVDGNGVANVPAATVISSMGSLNHECPHNPVTPADHRRKIEEAFLAMQGDDGSV